MAICKAMGVNYLQLMSDELPAFVVHDHIWNVNAQADHAPRDRTAPTQDLIAQELEGLVRQEDGVASHQPDDGESRQ